MDSASRLHGAVQSITSMFSRKATENLPPRISNAIRYPFGEFEFQLHAAPGQNLELQISRDFKHWETLDSLAAGKEASAISDKKAGTYPALFYRAVTGALISNYVGFLSVELPPGYSMIGNPLRAALNQVGELFPTAPEGSSLNKFNLVTFALNKTVFQRGKWSNPLETLSPGEGALFYNPSDGPLTARFVGEAPRTAQTLPVQTGTSMRGSQLPLAGRIDADLGFPIAPGDVVSIYSNHNEKYLERKYTEDGWAGDPPMLRLGEAFWISKNTPGVWTQQLPE